MSKQGTLLTFFNVKSSSVQQERGDNSESTNIPGTPPRGDNIQVPPPQKKKKSNFVRRYNDDYHKYGFIVWPESPENDPRPMCLICREFKSNDAMKPSKLLRHIQKKHPELEKKAFGIF